MSLALELRRRWWRTRVAGTPLAAHYAAPLPDRRKRVAELEFLALDFETTGLDPATDRILSIGWVPVQRLRLVLAGAGYRLLRGERGVGHSATIHGLVDADVDAGAAAGQVVPELLQQLSGRVLIAHGGAIELMFLARLCRELYAAPPTLLCYDTLRSERLLQPDLANQPGALRLSSCRERAGLPAYAAHNAASDALACGELFLAQLHRIGDPQQLRLADILL
jgi:DNA polymerase-3 subunit epsilon